MKQKILIVLIIGFFIISCQDKKDSVSVSKNIESPKWNVETLNEKALQHLDSSQWDMELLKQDIETFKKYPEVFLSYPLNKTPFPIATYDYAVSSNPFSIEMKGLLFKGVRIGEYENYESDKIIDKLTLMLLTNDKNAQETTFVDSRNYPYLTAQGVFKVFNNDYDWVFTASPDGFSILNINMKVFDLRFGETIIIIPQSDNSFYYEQLKDSPNNYSHFEGFKKAIGNNEKVKKHLNKLKP